MGVGAVDEVEDGIEEMVVMVVVDAPKDGAIVVTAVVPGPLAEVGSEIVNTIVLVPKVGMTVDVELLELGAILKEGVPFEVMVELLAVLDEGVTDDEDGVVDAKLLVTMLVDVELDCEDAVLEVEEEEEEFAGIETVEEVLAEAETVEEDDILWEVVVIMDEEIEGGNMALEDDVEFTVDEENDEDDVSKGDVDVADIVDELDGADAANEEDVAEGDGEDDDVKMMVPLMALPPIPGPRSDPAADTEAVLKGILEVTAVGLL